MHPVQIQDPPGVEVVLRCIDCGMVLYQPPPDQLITLRTLKTLVNHVYELDHEVIISAKLAK